MPALCCRVCLPAAWVADALADDDAPFGCPNCDRPKFETLFREQACLPENCSFTYNHKNKLSLSL